MGQTGLEPATRGLTNPKKTIAASAFSQNRVFYPALPIELLTHIKKRVFPDTFPANSPMNAFHHIRSFYPFVGQGVMELAIGVEPTTC